MFERIRDWLDVGEQEKGSTRARLSAVARVARRNVRMQNAEILTREDQQALVASGNESVSRLKEKLKSR